MKEIQLSQGKIAVIDDDDLPLVSNHRWFPSKHRTACRVAWYAKNRENVMMHRLILGVPKGQFVDHRDGDGLNNRRENIRICTLSQNAQNRTKILGASSQFKGVHWYKRNSKWHARIKLDGKLKFLGWFDEEIDAAIAYDNAARFYFGEFALTNFPEIGLANERNIG